MDIAKAKLAALLVPLASLLHAGDSTLADAAQVQDRGAVRSLLAQHADVNSTQADGVTPLHWAVHWDDAETVDLLIQAGANPSAADDLGVTPISLACVNGSGSMVKKLLGAGADPNAATSTEETPVMTCARTGNAAAVQALLSHGARVNEKEKLRDQTALMWAVSQRHPDVVAVLLEHGADVHARSRVTEQFVVRETDGARFVCPPDMTEEDRRKIAYKAEAVAGSSDVPTVSCAMADMAQKGGSTALLFAARVGDVASARLLIEAGANVNDVAPNGDSAVVVAAHSGQGKVGELLLEHGADPDASDGGYAALHMAVLASDLDLVKALLAHGANPDVKLSRGTPVLRENTELHFRSYLVGATPFFLAAKYVEVDMMRALAAAGADTRLGLPDGTSPLMAAAGVGWSAVSYTRRDNFTVAALPPPADDEEALAAVTFALELGGDARATNAAGDTALHGAANAGYAPIVRLLAEQGADVNAKNRRGQTPLSLIENPEESKGRHEVKTAELMLRKLGARSDSELAP